MKRAGGPGLGQRLEPAGHHRRLRRRAAAGHVVAVVSDVAARRARSTAPTPPASPPCTSAAAPGETRADYDARLADVVSGFDPDWVVLAGWMRLLTMSFLGWFPGDGRQPAPGAARRAARHPRHRAGLRRGPGRACAPRTGVMVHLVPDEGVDDGPVLATDDRRHPPPTTRWTRSRHACTPPSTACSSTRCTPVHRRPPPIAPSHRMEHPHEQRRTVRPLRSPHVRRRGHRPRLQRRAARHRRHLGHLRRRHRAAGAHRQRRDGQGHRGPHGHRHGPRGRHRRHPPQPLDRRPGGRGAEGEAQPERHDHRPGHAAAHRHAGRRRGADEPVQVQRRADHRRRRPAGRHPHQPRHALLRAAATTAAWSPSS